MAVGGVELGVQIIGSEIGVKNSFMEAISAADAWASATEAASVKAARSIELTGLSAKQAAVAYAKLGLAAEAAATTTEDSTMAMQAAAVRFETTMSGLYARQAAETTALAAAQERGAMRYESALMGTGRTMTTYVTLPLALAGYAAIKLATDFQASMTRVQTYAGASADEVKKMSAAILGSAGSIPQGPIQAAGALYHLESIGIRGPRALESLKAAAIASGAGMADLTDATTALGGALVADVKGASDAKTAMAGLVAIAGQGNMTMQDLSNALGTGLLVKAHNVGLSLREVGAAMDVLVDRGIPARRSATYLGTTFALMSAPSKVATNALADMGIKADLMGKMLLQPDGLLKVLEMLKEGMDRVGKAKGAADIMSAFGRSRQSVGILTLIESLDAKTSNYSQKLAGYDKGVADAAARMALYQTTPQYKMHTALSQVEADFIRLGTGAMPYVAEALKSMAGSVNVLVGAFDKLPAPMKEGFGVLVGLLAVGGPMLLGMGLVVKGVRQLGIVMRDLGVAGKAGAVGADESIASIGVEADSATRQVMALNYALRDLTLTNIRAGSGYMVQGAGGRFVGKTGPVGLVTNEPYGQGGYMVRNAVTGEYMGTTESVPPEMLINPAQEAEQTGMMAGMMSGAMSRLMPAMMTGMMGIFASQMLGSVIGGGAGHAVSDIGTGASIGAGIGFLAPELGGPVVGAALGAAAGGIIDLVHSSGSLNTSLQSLDGTMMSLTASAHQVNLAVTNFRLQRMQLQDTEKAQQRTVAIDQRAVAGTQPGTAAHAAAVRQLDEAELALKQTEQQLKTVTDQLTGAEKKQAEVHGQVNKAAKDEASVITGLRDHYKSLFDAMSAGQVTSAHDISALMDLEKAGIDAGTATQAFTQKMFQMSDAMAQSDPHMSKVLRQLAEITQATNKMPTTHEITILLKVGGDFRVGPGGDLFPTFHGFGAAFSKPPGAGGGGGGGGPTPFSTAQAIALALARNPNDKQAIEAQISQDNKAIAELRKRRDEGKINNLQYVNSVTAYYQDRASMMQRLATLDHKNKSGAGKAQSTFDRRVTEDSRLNQARTDLAQGEYAAAQKLLQQDLKRLELMLKEAKTSQERYAVEKQIGEVHRVMAEKAAGFQLPLALQAAQARADALAALDPSLQGPSSLQLELAKKAKAAAMKAIDSHTLTMQGLIAAWGIVGSANAVIAQAFGPTANLYHAVSTDAVTDAVKGLTATQEMQLRERMAQRAAHRGYAPVDLGTTSDAAAQHAASGDDAHRRRRRTQSAGDAGAAGTPAAGSGETIIRISGPMNFYGVQNVKELKAEIDKLARQGHSRAGGRR